MLAGTARVAAAMAATLVVAEDVADVAVALVVVADVAEVAVAPLLEFVAPSEAREARVCDRRIEFLASLCEAPSTARNVRLCTTVKPSVGSLVDKL